jgi:hypothetical protein
MMTEIEILTPEAAEQIRHRIAGYASHNKERFIIIAHQSGLDRWEIWCALYNNGFRGEALNGFLRRKG